ncbi:hypothetical protein [Ottowia sp.]|uniref:hypothetical protein n=1 Tax=Ottowia sp. TaxID=1898956 RepID=UPI002D1DD414|nr:hypothetical protein [Ottowia sp.]HOB67773.1 hypothetical protein [Ottowia sp.]HPZ56812.1 hypothetical protein [Ottowia sp.]HQD48725.1 hypothetical protein [Ottowia sp.]
MQTLTHTIAAHAARLVVEDGMDYGAAKRRAQTLVGASPRTALPDNELVEAEVRAYLALFHADTQPRELAALRRLALVWMERLADFRPHIGGAVWNGTATRLSDIYLQLFCDDPKSAELALIDHRVAYQARAVTGFHGKLVDALSFSSLCPELGEPIGVHLMIHDHDDLRGALKPGAQGRPPRGDRKALAQRLQQDEAP